MYVILSAVILNFTDPEKFLVKACFAAFLHKLQVHVTPHPHPIHTHTGTDKICDITFHVPTIDVWSGPLRWSLWTEHGS